MADVSAPLRGRQAEARRNDRRVLEASREVFAEQGPDASMADIARRAGVGVASLYARYPSKAELVRAISAAGMNAIIDAVEQARRDPDPWHGFTGFMQQCADAGAGGLMQLAGTFEPTDEHIARVRRMHDALDGLLREVKASGTLREEIGPADVYLLLASLRVQHPDTTAAAQLRRRYLAVLLAGLRAAPDDPLPGPSPTWQDLQRHWHIADE